MSKSVFVIMKLLAEPRLPPRRRGSAMQAEMAEEKFGIVSNLQRKPSMLSVLEPISENALYRRLVSSISWSSSPSEELEDRGVLSWGRQEVADWLVQIGMKQYQVLRTVSVQQIFMHSPICYWQVLFEEHGVDSGRSVLQLKEEHVREMGVTKVGHRLQLCGQISELRRSAKLAINGVDMQQFLSQ